MLSYCNVVEAVHPGGRGRLEHIAPDELALAVDEVLPGVDLVIMLMRRRGRVVIVIER